MFSSILLCFPSAKELKTHTILSSLSTSEVLRHNNDESPLRIPGRNVDISMLGHFNKLCEWFESEMQPVTTSEMQAKMIELAGDGVVYSMKKMKRKLESRYGMISLSVKRMANLTWCVSKMQQSLLLPNLLKRSEMRI